jgi:hypothetical protein
MMRYTENRYGKWIIPKKHLQAATEKLARFEDTEELEDVRAYCLQLKRVAKEKQEKEPEVASLLHRAADEIVNMSNFRGSMAADLSKKIKEDAQRRHDMKKEIFSFLDEIDGQIMDDPVAVIREKLEEVL